MSTMNSKPTEIKTMDAPKYLNTTVTLPAGRSIGMGKLKKATVVTLCQYHHDTTGKVFFTGFWIDAKTGKYRYTCVTQDEMVID